MRLLGGPREGVSIGPRSGSGGHLGDEVEQLRCLLEQRRWPDLLDALVVLDEPQLCEQQ